MRTLQVFTLLASLGIAISLTAAEHNVSRGTRESFLVTTNQVVRIETSSGAIALVRFTSFEPDFTASYRWRYRSSSSEPVRTGTGKVRESYQTPDADGHSEAAPDHEATVRAGDILIEWSVAGPDKGWLYCNTNSATIQMVRLDAFDKDF